MSAARESINNPNFCVWTDEDDNTWEFQYVVPLKDAEYLMYRKFRQPSLDDRPGTDNAWIKFPPFAEPPVKVMEFFHGPLNPPSDYLKKTQSEY